MTLNSGEHESVAGDDEEQDCISADETSRIFSAQRLSMKRVRIMVHARQSKKKNKYFGIYVYAYVLCVHVYCIQLVLVLEVTGTLAPGLCCGAQGVQLQLLTRTARSYGTDTSHSWEEDLGVSHGDDIHNI